MSKSILFYDPYNIIATAAHEFIKRMDWSLEGLSSEEASTRWNITMKFLLPVKFDTERALKLYVDHQNMRKNENLDRIWIQNPLLIDEIQSSKFYTLRSIENQPLTICFTLAHISTNSTSNTISTQDREVSALQALICQLDVATESMEVQRNGINFIYDMQNCTVSQFETKLIHKIVQLLQGNYPAMVKNIFIISPPKWFRVVYKVLSIFLSRKLRDRVNMFTVEQIKEYLMNQCDLTLDDIPIAFGGQFDPTISSKSRYETCLSVVTDPRSICSSYYSMDCQPSLRATTTTASNNVFRYFDRNGSTTSTAGSSLVAFLKHDNYSETKHNQPRKRESSVSSDSEKRRRSNSDLIDNDDSTRYCTLQVSNHLPSDKSNDQPSQLKSKPSSNIPNILWSDFDQQNPSDYQARLMNNDTQNVVIRRNNKRPNISEYRPLAVKEFFNKTEQEIRSEFRRMANPPAQDTYAACDERNIDKSRYRDVIPGEATRVKLQPDGNDNHDFINANYVSDYNNEKAYIFTQGPLQSTVNDFWRMVWQENIHVIVMTTNIRESGMVKCFPYWPSTPKKELDAGLYQICNENIENYNSFAITTLTLKNRNEPGIVRTIYHAHYQKWPDHGVPTDTKNALDFLEKVDHYRSLVETTAPVLLHCSAGIGRTGTFCAIDIGIKLYLERGFIDIASTVTQMRTERAGSVQTEDQYVFAHYALRDFIHQHVKNRQKRHESHFHDGRDLKDINEEVRVRGTSNLRPVDEQQQSKLNMTKSNGNQMNNNGKKTLSSLVSLNKTKSLNPNVTGSSSNRGKTLSDSSVPAVQHSVNFQPTLSNRQRASTEQIKSISSSLGSNNNKKARK